jgi:peptide/nickel transport system substrate-binding protein
MIKEQLHACGVEVAINYLPPAEMLAAGPEGPVFGRQFDLALFSWTTGSYHLGQIFQTYEIPGEYPTYPKGWGGANATGYSNPEFDLVCSTALVNLPDSEAAQEAVAEMQTIFAEDLPVLPLFFRQEMILSHPSLAGIQSGSFLPLWNIERIKLLE